MKAFTTLLLTLTLNTFAHDEGHGPAITDESMQGGKVTAIIDYKQVNDGRKAKMLYKGELVIEDLDVKLYIFDKKMNEVSLKEFDKTVNAIQLEKGKSSKFKLTLDKSKKFYKGTREKNKRVPYNIDVNIEKNGTKLFGAFDGLDK
ncbi:MAG: hypothetical protein CME65_00120 [Halobacteriovoraceae bacterium]|nr:hypothetical protein [Halobacteriovoraceae bacterium]|tara:strand:+ start:11111 stop:11548 length:438 start_codon:yes stop_codon:yes gene_type:complete